MAVTLHHDGGFGWPGKPAGASCALSMSLTTMFQKNCDCSIQMCRLQATLEILYLEIKSLPILQAGVDIGARLTRWGQLQPSQRGPSPVEALIGGLESTGSMCWVHALCTTCVTPASAPKCYVVGFHSVKVVSIGLSTQMTAAAE